jgi:hypothetical protein
MGAKGDALAERFEAKVEEAAAVIEALSRVKRYSCFVLPFARKREA